MLDDGRFMQIWQKYASVIHILLKNTDNKVQTLQLYKHEFEHIGLKYIPNLCFSIDLLNGKVANLVSSTGIAKDLCQVLKERKATKEVLSERRIRVTISPTFELKLEKIPEEVEVDMN